MQQEIKKENGNQTQKEYFSFFDRGTNLDFNELYSHYGPKQFQYYNMKGDQGAYPEATEPFISNEKFTNSFRNLCGPQTQPINEFITFYDAFAIEARTKWAKKYELRGCILLAYFRRLYARVRITNICAITGSKVVKHSRK